MRNEVASDCIERDSATRGFLASTDHLYSRHPRRTCSAIRIIAGSATEDQIGFLRLEPVVLNLPHRPFALKRDALTFETSRLIDEEKHRVARFLRIIGDIRSDGLHVRLRVLHAKIIAVVQTASRRNYRSASPPASFNEPRVARDGPRKISKM